METVISAIKTAIEKSRGRAVIDEENVRNVTSAPLNLVKELLVELVGHSKLEPRFFWPCEDGLGTTREATNVSDFPLVIECRRCGKSHHFDAARVEVHFVATADLLIDLSISPP